MVAYFPVSGVTLAYCNPKISVDIGILITNVTFVVNANFYDEIETSGRF